MTRARPFAPDAPPAVPDLDWDPERARVFGERVMQIWLELLERLPHLPVARTHTADEIRVVFQRPGVEPGPRGCVLGQRQHTVRIVRRQQHLDGTAGSQIDIAKEIDAPGMQARAQRGESGGADAGAEEQKGLAGGGHGCLLDGGILARLPLAA